MGNTFFRDNNINDTYGGRDLLKLGKTAQSVATQVRNNDFSDLYIGDYFPTTINNRQIKWHIAHFNYFLNVGDTPLTKPHLVLINDAPIAIQRMNPTNTTEGGYVNSEMRKTAFATYLNYLKSTVLGNYILTHRDLFTNSIDPNDKPAGFPSLPGSANDWGWYDSTIEMLSEPQVYGTTVFSSSGYDVGTGYTQFSIFRLNRQFAYTGTSIWWLRAIACANYFCTVHRSGLASVDSASYLYGVRIYFCFG